MSRYKLAQATYYTHLRRESHTHPGQYNSLECPFNAYRTLCGEQCPHFELRTPSDGVNGYRVTLTCSSCQKVIAIDAEGGLGA